MNTLMDLGQEVLKIREAIDSVEIKGVDQIKKNASYLTYAYDKCNAIIQAINQIAENQRQLQKSQNEVEEGRVIDGEQN